MKFKVLLGIIIVFCLVGVGIGVVNAKTIYVNENGWWVNPSDFNESTEPIQSAVDNSTTNDVIRIFNGSYTSTTTIEGIVNLTLIGNSSEGTIINSGDSNGIEVVNSAQLKIKNLKLTGNNELQNGVHVDNSNFCVIEYLDVSHYPSGITITNSENVKVKNCSSSYCNNDFGNGKGFLIHGDESRNNSLINNTATNCRQQGFRIEASNNTLRRNRAENNNDEGFFVRSSNNIEGNIAIGNKYGFLCYSNSILLNNTAKGNNNYGFRVSGSNSIIGNKAEDNGGSGFLIRRSNNSFYENTARDNGDSGFEDWISSNAYNNTYLNNIASSNSQHGFHIKNDNNRLDKNTIHGNVIYGIYLDTAQNTTITNNKLKDNGNYGINLSGASNHSLTSFIFGF